jgi:membrane protein YqaA with SNARE-associated domain
MSPAAICLSTFLGCLLGSFVPFVNTELVVLSAAAIAPRSLIIPLILIAASTQMLGKSVLYLAGTGLLHLPEKYAPRRLHDALERARRWPNTGSVFLFASATAGFPPFYVVSIAAGALRLPFPRFFLIGLCGRLLRFSAVVIVPQAIKSAL